MASEGYLLGLDIGSSSIKATVVDIGSGKTVANAQSPAEEMPMTALQPGWAEQDPDMWWQHAVICVRKCLSENSIQGSHVVAIGIAYQMHGLVIVGNDHVPLRKSIIWCDSRAVSFGDKAFVDLGEKFCLSHLLNSPGNFTASKLKWVKENEPAVFTKISKAMLPGDYIALKLSGDITTTDTGLSEGMFWDFPERSVSDKLLNYYGFDKSLIPNIKPVFSAQGQLRKEAAEVLGLQQGTKISYRSGDQPNNAFSLNVLKPGETAATAGTSGVIYSVTDKNVFDPKSRVNAFIHVNNSDEQIRNGILLCVNGTGIQNSWLRKNIKSKGPVLDYEELNSLAAGVPIGSAGVSILPFGNGAERILENREPGGSMHGINFNTHHQGHIFRAAQEGIVFALKYGFDILNEMGLKPTVIRAGKANMFLSPVFREAFANTIGVPVELYNTDGATGAALGAGIGAGVYSTTDAFRGLMKIETEEPSSQKMEEYSAGYARWKRILQEELAVVNK